MPDIRCEDLSTFIATAQKHLCTTVVVAIQREYGQHPEPTAVRYERLHQARCLAYKAGSIISCDIDNPDQPALTQALQAAGFHVEERSRNII